MNAFAMFEFVLLARMTAHYQEHVLLQAGLNRETAESLRLSSQLRYPFHWGQSIEAYESLLAVPAERRLRVVDSTTSGEYVQHDFPLGLWPNMYWSVQSVNGLAFAGVFRSRAESRVNLLNVAALQPGQVTLADLEAAGASWSLIDGWGERSQVLVSIYGADFEGEFVFGLLQNVMNRIQSRV